MREAMGDSCGGEDAVKHGGRLATDVDEVRDEDEAPSVGNLTPSNPDPSHVY